MIKRLAQASTAVIFMLAGGGGALASTDLPPEGWLDQVFCFWWSACSPGGGDGMFFPFDGNATYCGCTKCDSMFTDGEMFESSKISLPDFKTKASWLLTQNVLWGAWLDLPSGVSEFYFGPSHRFVPLDSLPDQTVKVKSSFHTRTSTGLHFLLYRADIPWRSTDYFIDIGTKPNAFQRVVCDPVCTEFPFENVPVNVESYWVQFPDDTFSILTDRNSLLIPGPVFDIPESDDSNRLDAPCRGCAGPLAVVAGGTLGLGYALSKLFGG